MKTLPQPWSAALEATMFSGWIYDHLKPHAAALKVAHPLIPAAVRSLASKNKKMYEHVFHFFGLRENPFHVSPDPRFFFSTCAHGSALTQLKMGVDTRQGLILLIGEAGAG